MIPSNIKETIDNYVKNRIHPGGFMYAVLCNDLFQSFRKADEYNKHYLFDIAKYVYNNVSMNCWGSKDIVDKWLEK